MRQNPVGEPAATAARNLATPLRRNSLKRLCPFFHCRQRYIRSLRRIHASQIGEHPRGLTKAEVATPSNQIRPQLFDDLWQGFTPCPASDLPDPRFEFGERVRRYAPLAPVVRDTKTQELPLFWPCHRALRLVDLQLEPVGQEPTHGSHDPLAGAATADVDVAVVGVAAEAVTPPFQFLVEIIEHEVAQKGRKRAALRRPFIHRTDQTVLHYPGVEKRPDELEYALVGNSFRDARHQNVVIDSVEKFLEIQVDHDVVAFGDIPLRLGHRLMGRTSRTETVAML